MSEREKDGGPAFSFEYTIDGEGVVHPGMSLRDWFAGQALAGLMQTPLPVSGELSDDRVARACYCYADAMLKAREERGGELQRWRPMSTAPAGYILTTDLVGVVTAEEWDPQFDNPDLRRGWMPTPDGCEDVIRDD